MPFSQVDEAIYKLDEVVKLLSIHIIKPDLQVVVIDL